jgi:TonB family protein
VADAQAQTLQEVEHMRLRAPVTLVLTLALTNLSATAGDVHAVSDAWKLPSTARAMSATNEEIYPQEAVRRGIEGRVLAAFDITTDGNAVNVEILWAEDRLLAEATRHALAAFHFDVPDDWEGYGVRRRWRMGFVYCLPPSEESDDFVIPVDVTTIKVSRQPAVPVLAHPGAHPSVACAQ